MKLLKGSVLFIVLLLITSCNTVTDKDSSADKPDAITEDTNKVVEDTEKKVEEPEKEMVDLSNFFMEDGAVANYLGDGNEYASYRARTQWHNENSVSVYEDNGGTTVLRTYRITEESIDLIKEEGEFYDKFNPSDEELRTLPKLSTLLQLPLEEGKSFDDWMIISINQTIATPYQTFEKGILLEKTDESGAIQRKYFVSNFGEIKREFIMSDDEIEFSVTSTLESVE
ncbi:hypothetical protein [Paenisporosarcina antarctica]|uniref:Outer membrane lipoprotein carrier protein LolA n=1 Tax=Paenisporosarcina antarctica TaxID=417367 RepID=A0A4V1AN11_9BACL|nr:hypothetical protein [Paenisporosarcina antarctica]QBP41155.1 hypothetical protein E2636_08435 [Paenisporosarcina antarctica]